MGHVAISVEPAIVYVGIARMPQPLVTNAPALAVEIETAVRTGTIVAISTNLGFPGLVRLLNETLVGRPIGTLLGAQLLEIEVRYCAPFVAALRVALQNAARQATEPPPDDEAPSRIPAALAAPQRITNGNGARVAGRNGVS